MSMEGLITPLFVLYELFINKIFNKCMKIKISESKLRGMIEESVRKTLFIENQSCDYVLDEDFKRTLRNGLLGLGMAATMASCGNGVMHGNTPDDPTQTEISNKDRQYAKFDWSLITDEENQGFIYDMYSSCAASGSSHIACIIQKDKYCWRYYVPYELENEIGEKYRNKEVVDIRQLEPFTGWRGYK